MNLPYIRKENKLFIEIRDFDRPTGHILAEGETTIEEFDSNLDEVEIKL